MAIQSDSLLGQRALVTGATSGIGRAVALQLAREGAEVIVQGRSERRGSETLSEIRDAGGQALFLAADLNDPVELRRLADESGEVDVLVNNAGISWFGPTEDLDVDTFEAMFATNVRAPYFLVTAIAPKMAAKGAGSIINVGSMVGEIGISGAAAYGSTEVSLASMTRSWAAEFSPHGVRINTVASGPAYTNIGPAERTTLLGGTTLLRRAAAPQEIAEVVTFLASSRASYVTGATIAADGGRAAI